MKFTKEEAVEKLNQQLTNGGKKPLRMSTKTLNEHTENLMSLVADDEMELDDFITKVKPMLENVNSNMEKDRSDFIKEYEKAHPTEPKPGEPKPGEPKPGEKSEIAKIREELDLIKAQRAREDDERAVAAKRSEIRKYLTDNNVKDEKWIDSILSIANISKDDDAEEKGKTYLEFYNKSHSPEESITPITPKPGDVSDPKDMFAAVRALRKDPEDVSK